MTFRLKNPLTLSIFGWLAFPSMYLLVGVLTAIGMEIALAFGISSFLGILGLIAWIAAICIAAVSLTKKQNIVPSIVSIILSIAPIIILLYVLKIAPYV